MFALELSIVIPCLNEAATIRRCIQKAQSFLTRANVHGEVVVADNGSTDGSVSLAIAAGARVVNVKERGYGSALRAGIAAAQGRFVIMGDGDDSYDFEQLDNFVDRLRDGHDLVVGNRFKGGIASGAMPFLHRYVGNPVLSYLGRLFFKIPIGDFHCGLRGFDRHRILSLGLRSTGMEFASEMIIKSALARFRICEVKTKLSKDGRGRSPHLRTWRDGWRHLRFLLTLSPRWLFMYPGLLLLVIGGGLQLLLAHGGLKIGSIGFDIHTMLYAGAMSVIGVQMVWFAVLAKAFGSRLGILPTDDRLERLLRSFTLERGLALGLVLLGSGVSLSFLAVQRWANADYGVLNPREVMRTAIPSVSLMLIGVEFMIASFLFGMLRFEQQRISVSATVDNNEIPDAQVTTARIDG